MMLAEVISTDTTPDISVVVAMSGGVDSSVAALLLSEQGYSVVGVSMQVWDYRRNQGNSNRGSCCAPSDFSDARRVASRLDMPYYVVDFEEVFRKEVIDTFVSSYYKGMTPNPCVDCNSKVKFRELRAKAQGFGCNKIATGHYARIEKEGSDFKLLRGKDLEKDQSYFLYNLKQSELAETLFPVGHLTKVEVREKAREAGLVTADKPESQDICFVTGTVQDFLVKIGGKRETAGEIVTLEGKPLANHEGVQNFTVGQRKGLKIGGNQDPLYVVEIDPSQNRVVVGGRADLERESFLIHDINWIAQEFSARTAPFSFSALAQVRSRHRGVLVDVLVDNAGQASVTWKGDDWAPVSPGQACVFYSLDNDEVYGGGRISPRLSRE